MRQAPLEETAIGLWSYSLVRGEREGPAGLRGFSEHPEQALGTRPLRRCSSCPLGWEVEERASLGASQIHSAATTALSVLEVPLVGRQEEFGALVSGIKRRAWAKRASCPSWGRRG